MPAQGACSPMASADDSADPKGFRVNDRRWWLQEDADLDALAATASDTKPSYIGQLEAKMAGQERELQAAIQAHKQAKADLEDVRERLEREQQLLLQVERARLAEPFLQVLDGLQHLLEASVERPEDDPMSAGAKLVIRMLEDRLREIGLERIEATGQPFDPNTMEALMTAEVDPGQVDQVIEVVRPGYVLGERIVRPAGVRVGVARRE